MSALSQVQAFKPRKGQQDLIEYLPQIQKGDVLSVQWPTGYGKSIGFALAWKHCCDKGIANRFLLVVANDTQRTQIINDFPQDCRLTGAWCKGKIWTCGRDANDVATARAEKSVVFVCTVHQLANSFHGTSDSKVNVIRSMLMCPGTRWMIGFDEYHHYGQSMAWGEAAKLAMEHSEFSLAMSATPYRRTAVSVFPEPGLVVTYSDAIDQKAVKPIVCHSYEYNVAIIEGKGEVATYTTTELMDLVGGDINVWEERQGIRYSPQYLHPLIMNPLQRLRQTRAETGKRLQMLVRAMSCGHAKMVCEQVRMFADGLSVDWVGTIGRSEEENRSVLARFCPPKNQNGTRPDPDLDVLVQVCMAGEGFDSINVVEIVDLFPVSKKAIDGRATQDKQFYGRGARMIRGCEGLTLRVNIPSDHPLHEWGGKSLATWMDSAGGRVLPPSDPPKDPVPPGPWDFPEFVDREIELISVIADNEAFQAFAAEACRRRGYNIETDEDELKQLYLAVANCVAKEQSAQARLFQIRESIDAAIGRYARYMAQHSDEVSGSVIGRYKKEMNARMKRQFNKARNEMDSEELELAEKWLRNLFQNMKGLGI